MRLSRLNMTNLPGFTAMISLQTEIEYGYSYDSGSFRHNAKSIAIIPTFSCPPGHYIKTTCLGIRQYCECCFPGPHGSERCLGNNRGCGGALVGGRGNQILKSIVNIIDPS